MAKFFPMFSSSKGNSTYVGGASGGVLIDAGVSFRKIKNALCSAAIPLDDIKAILITHEHSDHIKGLRVLLKNLPVPIIASRDTVYALEFAGAIERDTPRMYIDETKTVDLDGMKICRFPTSHDCKGSSGYTISVGDIKAAVCTDLGIVTDEVKGSLYGCDIVMLESNHDPTMLRLGPYSAELKIRIGSDKGHLSNAVCAQTVSELYTQGTRRFVLAHLSEENNTPEKAASTTRDALLDKGATENIDYILYVAPREGNRVIPL